MKRAISPVLLILFLLVGCASTGTVAPGAVDQTFVSSAYKTLYAEAGAVDAAMTAMGALYQAGQFSEANKTRAIAADTLFKTGYDTAVNALVSYSQTPSAASLQAAQARIDSLQVQAAGIAAMNVAEILTAPKPAAVPVPKPATTGGK